MRVVKYKTHWSYFGPAVKRQEPLVEFVLDIPYLMASYGVIPPLHVLDEVLQEGGDDGGMSPGTTWRPFKIKKEEYEELVQTLLNLNVDEARKKHPYVRFKRVIIDKALNQKLTYREWSAAVHAKYPFPLLDDITRSLP
ncbi:MAG: hypothetical protein IT324_04850 [Anaerolineae bacterium]|nr:hypothetical protein [Anaerolineae bacterium]